ncbi:hypothetical protein R1sor_003456 [Riccia sorocarpa]|uniref:Protein SERAC1 n=1 Tax=Riccia sorocarpa TaxID=122646 RepID=A0ABD3H5K3_9MARC
MEYWQKLSILLPVSFCDLCGLTNRDETAYIPGFLELLIDLFDEEQFEETQAAVLWILYLFCCDPEQQSQFLESRLFSEKCSKLLLCRHGRRLHVHIETEVTSICRDLIVHHGNEVLTKTVQSLVSCGLRELVGQLKKSDEEQEEQASLFKLLLNRSDDGWVNWMQIGDYFLGATEALRQLVSTSVHCQQDNLRGDVLEILGICTRCLEDGTNPLQLGEDQRQQQLQMILQAVSTILNQMSVGRYSVLRRFLGRLDVDCRQSSCVILKYPEAVQSLIQLSIQDADQTAKGDALHCLYSFVWSLDVSEVSNITGEGIYLLQELSKALGSIAGGTEADNSIKIQLASVKVLYILVWVNSKCAWGYKSYKTKSAVSCLSEALKSRIVGDTNVLEYLVALLHRDELDGYYDMVIVVLLYAGENSARALDHIAQLPRSLERLAELVSGANGGVQQAAFRFVRLLIEKNTSKIRARASDGLLMCLVHVISTKVGGESLASQEAIRLLVLCAVQNNKALSYLTGLLGKPIRDKHHFPKYTRTCTSSSPFAESFCILLMDPKSELVRLNDAVYLVYDGNRKGRGCQIVFLHGLQVNHEEDEDTTYLRNCWSSRDGSELWPKCWLAKSFPTASIYLVKYDSRLLKDPNNIQKDMYITAEGILSSLLLQKIGQSPKNPVILVGQDIGGLVIKEICLQASRHEGEEEKRLFSQQVKGIVYYSTPHLGVDVQFGDRNFHAELVKVLTIHNEDISRSNEAFRKLGEKRKWRTMALWPSRVGLLNVKEGTARFNVDIFCPIDASSEDICRPEDRSSSSFLELEKFIHDTLFRNRNAKRPKLDFKEDPKYVPLLETSNNIRSRLADPKCQVVVLYGDAGTGKSGVSKYLALQYDKETGSESEFWDGVFYVDCGRGAKAVDILRRLMRELKEQDTISAATEDVEVLTFRLKEKLQDLSALMIFDDVSGDDRSSLVEKLVIPSAENVKYLFTSQESRGWHGFCLYKIDRITVATAEEIMAKRTGLPSGSIPEADRGIVLEIIKATDLHPLALASVAAAVQKNEKGGVDLSEWKEVNKNLLSYLTDERAVAAFGKLYLPGSVFAAMMFAVQGLHRKNKRLFTALCILALFEGPFPKKVPLFLLLSTTSRLSEHIIRLMKDLEERGFLETVEVCTESMGSVANAYYLVGDIYLSVPSCKMHSLRQQFMLCFLRFSGEDITSFSGLTVEFIESVRAIQQIISPFFNEAPEGGDSDTTVVSISAVIFSLYGAKEVSSKLPKAADLLREDDILKANFGMLMEDIEHDSDSSFLLDVQTVLWKYIVEGAIDDVSMANLIARPSYAALHLFSYYHTGVLVGQHGIGNNAAHEWFTEKVFPNRKSLRAVFRLLSSSSTDRHVQMFVLQLLGGMNCIVHEHHPAPEVFRDIILAEPVIEHSIMKILKAIAEDVNRSPLVVSETDGEDRFQNDWTRREYWERRKYYESASFSTLFYDSVIRPVRSILSAVKILDVRDCKCDESGRVEFDIALNLVESISKPLLCITRILNQSPREAQPFDLACTILCLITELSVYTDKRGRSSMDFMPHALESMVSWIVEDTDWLAVKAGLRLVLGAGAWCRSQLASVRPFIPKLADVIKRRPLDMEALEYFLHFFQGWDDITEIPSTDKDYLSAVLFMVLSEINQTQTVGGWTEMGWKTSTVLLLLGYPLKYPLDCPCCLDIGPIQLQPIQSMDAESRATKLLDGLDRLFDIIEDSQCKVAQVVGLKIMVFLLERCPGTGARSIFWRPRAVSALASLLEEHDEKIKELAVRILLRMPSRKRDTSYWPPDGYSCMQHVASMSCVPMHIFKYIKYRKQKGCDFFLDFVVELKEVGVSCLLDTPELVKDIVCVLRENSKEGYLGEECISAIVLLFCLLIFDTSGRVSSQLVTVPESIETLMRASKCHMLATRGLNVHKVVRRIFSSFTSEQGRVILRNPAVQEVMHGMILSLQKSDQSVIEFSKTVSFLLALVKEESGVEHVLSFPGSVEAVVTFLMRIRKEQVESCSHSSVGSQKERREILAKAVCTSSSFLMQLVRGTFRPRQHRIFGMKSFLDLLIDLIDEEQLEETQANVLQILHIWSCDPGQLGISLEKHRFPEKCSKLLLCRRGRRRGIEAGATVICLCLAAHLGVEMINETRELVARGLLELVSQLKESDEEQEEHAFLFKLLLDRTDDGWVHWIQIGYYFLGASEALDRLVSTSVYCQQENLRGDALEILGICTRCLEDGTNPLQLGEDERQQQLQMILQAVSTILNQMSVGRYRLLLKFLRRLGVDCRQSLCAILKYPEAVQSLIQLSVQDDDQEAKGDALHYLYTCVSSLPSEVSNITVETNYLLQELSKALPSVACGLQSNSIKIQIASVEVLYVLVWVKSEWEYQDYTTKSAVSCPCLSGTLKSRIVGDTHVLENLVAFLDRDEPDAYIAVGMAIALLVSAGDDSDRALDHIAQLPRTLERLAELVSGANELVSGANGTVQQAAFLLVRLLIEKNTCKTRSRASDGLLMCLVHIISTKVGGEEMASQAIRLLVRCAVRNNKSLSCLIGLLEKHIRSVLRVDATVFLMGQRSKITRDSEKCLLPSLQTVWRSYFPGKYWESYFPDEDCFDSADNLEARLLAGLIWLSEISLSLQQRIAESLTGIHAGELEVVERDFAISIVPRCRSLLLLLVPLLLCILVCLGWR